MSKFFFKKKIKEEGTQPTRMMWNIGALLDVPTARFAKGLKGETVMIGGLGPIFGVMGGPNTYKSSFLYYCMLSALSRICESGFDTIVDYFDTEQTAVPDRLEHLSKAFSGLKDRSVIGEEIIQISDGVEFTGDEWLKKADAWLTEIKVKDKKNTTIELPILNYDGNPISMYFPTFGAIDSLSEMPTDSVEDIEDKSTISSSEGNMIFMRDGLAKQKLMMRLGRLCTATDHYMLLSAHIGEKFDLATGPMAPKPTKDLPHMKATEKAKNVPKKFLFLPTTLFQTVRVSPFINQGTKGEEFPKHSKEEVLTNIDLNKVTINCTRSKVGPSGWDVDIILSQKDGILPSVTELNFLRERGNFGLIRAGVGGSIYSCVLLPDVKFTRNSLRETLDKEPRLVRALNICAELLQLKTFHSDLAKFKDMEEIYTKLTNVYNMDDILNSRGWFALNQYEHPVPYLSCVDIVDMANGVYHPYWMPPLTVEEKKAA